MALRFTASLVIATIVLLLPSLPQAQGTPPATRLTLLSRDGRRPVPTTMLSGQEFIALDDVATLFQVHVREDTLAGGITVTYNGRTIVASTDQPMASVSGRVVSLPSPAVRIGDRWFVPLEFLPRALEPIYGTRIDLRRASRLLIVGDLRVPRVTARIDAVGPPTRATITISPAASAAVTVEAGRVVTRIDADALDLGLPAAGGGLIEAIRPGDQPTTVVAVLGAGAGSARAAPVQSGNVTRVTIEVTAAAPPPSTTTTPAPPPEPASPPLPVPVAPRAALQTIVLDPGHGGDDAGVRGAGGAEEKQITLQVARRLRSLIETRLGIRVVLTRDDDRSVSLDERAAVANNGKADLFLSLHANAAPSSAVAGAEVFRLRLDEEAEAARRLAEAQAVSLPVLGGASRTIEVIRWDLAQARHIEASTVLASLLEQDLRAQVAMGPRPSQEAPLRVLSGVNMPAALVELAYLTNTGQAQQAQSETFQNTLAQALYNAVLHFRAYVEGERDE